MSEKIRILEMTAIGDAMGAGYEYLYGTELTRNFLFEDGFRQHPKHHEILPGMWTDDTMMSVAAAQAIIHHYNDSREPMYKVFASTMVDLHRTYPTKGYSRGMLQALDASRTGYDLIKVIDKHGQTEKNGSAMRSAVYGIIPEYAKAIGEAGSCATVTHKGLGVEAAQVVAGVVHYFYHQKGTKDGLMEFVGDSFGGVWTTRFRSRVAASCGPLGFITVLAAIGVIRDCAVMTRVITESIRFGGDVDTVAAIACAIASVCPEIENNLPQSTYDAIRPVAGLTFDDIKALDTQLLTVAER